MPATAYAHDEDPREKLLKAIGDVSSVDIFHNQLLIGIYIAPERTKGGIIRPQQNVEEDRYQSKVGLVLKLGPRAFISDDKWFWPDDIGEGDWVFFKISDSFACTVNQQPCRILNDVDVKGRVEHPDTMW